MSDQPVLCPDCGKKMKTHFRGDIAREHYHCRKCKKIWEKIDRSEYVVICPCCGQKLPG